MEYCSKSNGRYDPRQPEAAVRRPSLKEEKKKRKSIWKKPQKKICCTFCFVHCDMDDIDYVILIVILILMLSILILMLSILILIQYQY